MNVTDLLTEDTITLDLQATSKSDVLAELADQLARAGRLNDKDTFLKNIIEREKQSTTGISEGIAIPHAKSAAVKTPAIAFGRSSAGIDFDSLDGQPTHLFFMIAANEDANNAHLKALSRLATFLMDPKFQEKMYRATSKAAILAAVNAKEAEMDKSDETEKSTSTILAVTACPTGIAHTYMAAEKLEETAKEMGIRLKVETNGSSGIKNRLTDQEIANADTIIVAADTKVEMERFSGKPVIETGVGKAIHEAKDLLNRAIHQEAPIYEGEKGKTKIQDTQQRGGFYKHLMNGVSNMLPFVVGGGILIAISFFWGIHAAEPDSSEYNVFAYMIHTIGSGKAFFLMVPVLAGFIASSIADRPGFAPGMISGLIATTVTGAQGAEGGSGFLGGLIAGFLAGYMTLLVKKAFEKLPDALEGLKPVLFYPLFSIAISGCIMMVINPPLTKIYTGLTSFLESMSGTNQILVGIILGAMMALDLGGPVNKAAYTFGIAMLDAHNYTFMATVMAAGMVPPLGMALATTLFRKRFTKQEREAGKTAYALGACFITEGVIPFAAADPARVIPSAMIGAAVTGGLSMLFHIGLPAPHGGIFVIGLIGGGIGKIMLYLAAIIIGSIITALIAGLLKKNIQPKTV
ncbi:fructose-specific PTS transporter subunit EIIC [Lentibacillus sp. N15]|uniref:PTS fructose transporter subunit IIABC n=1 Tax=Lentibacillus songyuanensis TaxID=3136161 RepID=UPI0031B9FBEC